MFHIESSEADHIMLMVDLGDSPVNSPVNSPAPVPALWLRELSPSQDQLDRITQQRLFNPHQLDEDLHYTAIELNEDHVSVEFSDGYKGMFPKDTIIKALRGETIITLPPPIAWKAEIAAACPKISWQQLEAQHNDEAMLEALTLYYRYGFIIIDDIPITPEGIKPIAHKFGFIRTTNFGEVFDVVSKPLSDDLAYRSVALDAHTDNPYREPTPGIQLLFCLVNETAGGLSMLADSFACIDQLKAEDPQAFALLGKVKLTFQYKVGDQWLASERPMLELDQAGNWVGLHYSPRLDKMPLMPPQETKLYHHARRRLSTLFADPLYEFRFLLKPGSCMLFDNNRVLHGRTAYNQNEGLRHLQGCYIDRDALASKYRYLKERI